MKRIIAVLLALMLALASTAFAGELAENEKYCIYFVQNDSYVSLDATGSGLKLAPVGEGAVFEIALDGEYISFKSEKGYLTSGATGNSIAYTNELTDLGLWKIEDAGNFDGIYLRNKGAMYKESPQYLEYYSGKITVYGLKNGGSAYLFKVVPASECVKVEEPVDENRLPFTLKVMQTSDIHGTLYHTDYSSGRSGSAKNGLTRLASVIANVRKANENTLLIDVGDTVQGTPLTYYYCYERPDAYDPAVKALRTLHYDAWVLGNHEFNYGLGILGRQIEYAQSEGIGGESSVPVLAANFRVAGESEKPWVGDIVKREYDLDGATVRVGVIGLTTPNIPNWEPKENYAGIEFNDFASTFTYYADALSDCDIVIAACHSGIEGEGEIDNANQIRALVESNANIDLVLGGHSHETGTFYVKNADGENVTVLMSGSRAYELGLADIQYDPATGEIIIDAETVPAGEIDSSLAMSLSPFERECWRDYMNEIIGVSEGEFESAGNMLVPCAFLDLIGEIQLDSGYDKIGYTATEADDVKPQLSFSAALNSGDGVLIPKGDITYGSLFSLYRFENWLYTVKMNHNEIRAWLECAADRQYGIDANGIPFGGGTYCDCLYGEGLEYEIDISLPAGERVKYILLNGEPLDETALYSVVINNYRYTGGGSYVKYVYNWLTERNLPTDLVYHEDGSSQYQISDERQVFSTQYNMPSGEDRGQVRTLIADYIRLKGTINPTVTSNWSVKF